MSTAPQTTNLATDSIPDCWDDSDDGWDAKSNGAVAGAPGRGPFGPDRRDADSGSELGDWDASDTDSDAEEKKMDSAPSINFPPRSPTSPEDELENDPMMPDLQKVLAHPIKKEVEETMEDGDQVEAERLAQRAQFALEALLWSARLEAYLAGLKVAEVGQLASSQRAKKAAQAQTKKKVQREPEWAYWKAMGRNLQDVIDDLCKQALAHPHWKHRDELLTWCDRARPHVGIDLKVVDELLKVAVSKRPSPLFSSLNLECAPHKAKMLIKLLGEGLKLAQGTQVQTQAQTTPEAKGKAKGKTQTPGHGSTCLSVSHLAQLYATWALLRRYSAQLSASSEVLEAQMISEGQLLAKEVGRSSEETLSGLYDLLSPVQSWPVAELMPKIGAGAGDQQPVSLKTHTYLTNWCQEVEEWRQFQEWMTKVQAPVRRQPKVERLKLVSPDQWVMAPELFQAKGLPFPQPSGRTSLDLPAELVPIRGLKNQDGVPFRHDELVYLREVYQYFATGEKPDGLELNDSLQTLEMLARSLTAKEAITSSMTMQTWLAQMWQQSPVLHEHLAVLAPFFRLRTAELARRWDISPMSLEERALCSPQGQGLNSLQRTMITLLARLTEKEGMPRQTLIDVMHRIGEGKTTMAALVLAIFGKKLTANNGRAFFCSPNSIVLGEMLGMLKAMGVRSVAYVQAMSDGKQGIRLRYHPLNPADNLDDCRILVGDLVSLNLVTRAFKSFASHLQHGVAQPTFFVLKDEITGDSANTLPLSPEMMMRVLRGELAHPPSEMVKTHLLEVLTSMQVMMVGTWVTMSGTLVDLGVLDHFKAYARLQGGSPTIRHFRLNSDRVAVGAELFDPAGHRFSPLVDLTRERVDQLIASLEAGQYELVRLVNPQELYALFRHVNRLRAEKGQEPLPVCGEVEWLRMLKAGDTSLSQRHRHLTLPMLKVLREAPELEEASSETRRVQSVHRTPPTEKPSVAEGVKALNGAGAGSLTTRLSAEETALRVPHVGVSLSQHFVKSPQSSLYFVLSPWRLAQALAPWLLRQVGGLSEAEATTFWEKFVELYAGAKAELDTRTGLSREDKAKAKATFKKDTRVVGDELPEDLATHGARDPWTTFLGQLERNLLPTLPTKFRTWWRNHRVISPVNLEVPVCHAELVFLSLLNIPVIDIFTLSDEDSGLTVYSDGFNKYLSWAREMVRRDQGRFYLIDPISMQGVNAEGAQQVVMLEEFLSSLVLQEDGTHRWELDAFREMILQGAGRSGRPGINGNRLGHIVASGKVLDILRSPLAPLPGLPSLEDHFRQARQDLMWFLKRAIGLVSLREEEKFHASGTVTLAHLPAEMAAKMEREQRSREREARRAVTHAPDGRPILRLARRTTPAPSSTPDATKPVPAPTATATATPSSTPAVPPSPPKSESRKDKKGKKKGKKKKSGAGAFM